MRYESKDELLWQVRDERQRLMELVGRIPAARRDEAGVWGDGWTACDLLAHLAAWHRMFLRWYAAGLEGRTPSLPAPGYRWNETPRLNRDIQAEHAARGYDNVARDFQASYDEVYRLLDSVSEAELLEPGHFPWTGKNALVTYAGANTASHYRFAQKVLKRWLKQVGL